MPRKPLKPCKHNGCPNLTDEMFCEEHKKYASRNYEKCRRNKTLSKHYSNTNWRKRRAIYISQNPLCERCLSKGRMTTANLVHHIVPVSQGGSDDEDNLMALCRSCHEHIHSVEIKDKGFRR